ncbi:MAG: alcohol dehydrogenase catalytic domain-containing protein, partial [Leucobacter sp.]|nr:alcohol dehydrogenase catalytic domain-containing protein [Leucobacter sp.]
MRAIVVNEVGGPEVLEWAEIEDVRPGPGELLIETAAAGVNFIEIYQRSGVYQVDLPFTPGTEAAGTVVEVGAGVTGFAPGDRVATSTALATYAERFAIAADQVARVPDWLDLETAAALPLQGCTAHYLATSAAHPQPGETVLVHAGAGGIGQVLTQLLVARGVRVLTTASTEAKQQLSLDAGAMMSFGYEGFAERARE